ncbi:hypothetical protein PtrSN002B_011787 [Pyrenophora tritici-repentis]|uniref:Uncharacterized protein n=1 Tax=Pyrenophora tritici-repentis TaxID=45151 RepID=A0A2W1CPD3_9PLEO|nr:hypothetical protein PtrV1_00037 [Pyrenophora tritici-repentis]KAF7575785.1 hypothetical protein PtrM4_000250 [Pyrenophora tritici-repentis]KAG9377793.1 hypothetical protein A1F94_012196 [Pyrenophora tritici-repentis]KAI1521618.1 hypothetical protein PtrSN001C_012167 [Pyrenophora tritici-repentis]KAI1522597.1 hypothetical protein PtrSN001A_011681 [Pyrenophora tritici-repentis]
MMLQQMLKPTKCSMMIELDTHRGTCRSKQLYRQRIPMVEVKQAKREPEEHSSSAQGKGKSQDQVFDDKCTAIELSMQGQIEALRYAFDKKLDTKFKQLKAEFEEKLAAEIKKADDDRATGINKLEYKFDQKFTTRTSLQEKKFNMGLAAEPQKSKVHSATSIEEKEKL